MAKAPPVETTEAAPAPSKKKKILILGIIALLVLTVAGAGTLLLLKKKHQNPEDGEEEEIAAEQQKKAKKAEKKTPPVFAKLDIFTVNLAPDKENNDQYLQIAISLELEDALADAHLKASMPKVRDSIIRLLASKKAAEIATSEGKDQLALSLKNALNLMLDPPVPKKGKKKKVNSEDKPEAEEEIEGPIVSVLFTDFIIQ